MIEKVAPPFASRRVHVIEDERCPSPRTQLRTFTHTAIASLLLGILALGAPVYAQTVEGVADDKPPSVERPSLRLRFVDRVDFWDASGADEATAHGLVRLPFHQPTERHPVPRHTGFKALLFETANDFNAFPRRTSTWVLLAIGGGAAAAAHPSDGKVNGHLAGSPGVANFFKAGKWLGSAYVQGGTAAGVYLVGRYLLPHAEGDARTNKVSHLGFDLMRALIVSQALTHGIKATVRRDRPTGECCAFPSGHASAAFATASVLERHLGYRGAWPTLALATYVATSRLYDNRHYLSDVLFGGALGIASGWSVVGRHGRSNYSMAPVPVLGGVMVIITRSRASQ